MNACMHSFTILNVTCGYLCRYGNTSPHRLHRNTVLTLGMKGKAERATNTTNRAASKRLSNVFKAPLTAASGGLLTAKQL